MSNWKATEVRQRLEAVEEVKRQLDARPSDKFGSGEAWARYESVRMDLYRQEKAYLYEHARRDLASALDRIAELEDALMHHAPNWFTAYGIVDTRPGRDWPADEEARNAE